MVTINSPVTELEYPSICHKASEAHLAYLVFVNPVLRLWIFDVHIVSIKVHRIIIEHVGCTLDHVTQTLLFPRTKLLLESLLASKLESAFYDGDVTGVISIIFEVCDMAKAIANLNMILLVGRETQAPWHCEDIRWSE